MGGWKSERMENIVVFPLMCLVGGVESGRIEKFFVWLERKMGRMENVIYVN